MDQDPALSRKLPVTPPATEEEVRSVAPVVTAACPELACGEPAEPGEGVPAVVVSEVQPGANAAGPSTPLRAGTPASTLVPEPEVERSVRVPGG